MKCPGCKSVLESDATFCTNCGKKLESVVKAPPKEKSGGGCAALFAKVCLLLVGVALAGLGYYAYDYAQSEGLIDKFKERFKSSQVSKSNTIPQATPPTSRPTEVSPPVSTQPPKVKPPKKEPGEQPPVKAEPELEDFGGTWYADESGNRVDFKMEMGQVVARMGDGGELRLGFLNSFQGYTVHGTFSDGKDSYPASAEISRDRQSLKLTLAPPASEYWVVTLSRSKGEVPDEIPGEIPDEIPGIESLKLDEAATYLPLINAQYRFYMKFPDGDEGTEVASVAALGDDAYRTVLTSVDSKLYPGETAQFLFHYLHGSDGVYVTSDVRSGDREMWLPNKLKLGKSWSSQGGRNEVVAFDSRLTVSGIEFTGVLVIRETMPELELDRTSYIAPGYGEILVKDTKGSFEWRRFLDFVPADADKIGRMVDRYNSGK